MRITPVNLAAIYYINGHPPKNGRRPQTRPFPYNGCLPLALRNEVSAKGDRENGVACVYEMAEMLACLKLRDFNEKLCSKETLNFKNCYAQYRETQKKREVLDKEGILTPGETNLTAKQLNTLLRKYKQPGISR